MVCEERPSLVTEDAEAMVFMFLEIKKKKNNVSISSKLLNYLN